MIDGEKPDCLPLLECLAVNCGCIYLSDLHEPYGSYRIAQAVKNLSVSDYSLQEWNDAVKYITGQPLQFKTVEQAIDYLLNDATKKGGSAPE